MKNLQIITYILAIVAYSVMIPYYLKSVGVLIVSFILAVLILFIKSIYHRITGIITLVLLTAVILIFFPNISKNDVHEFTWMNVTTQNQFPTSDIPIDIQNAKTIIIEPEIFNEGNHLSKDWDFNILVSAKKEGPFKYFFDLHFKNNDKLSATPMESGPNFMKISLDVNDGKRADVKALITVGY